MSDLPDVEFNVGVDVEEIARFSGQAERVAVLFSADEVADAELTSGATRLTGTWCAKEATVKALWPWVRLDPRRVTVRRDADGRPHVDVSGWDADEAGVRVRVSISHSDTVATATAVAWGRAPAREGSPEGEPQP